MKIKFEISEVFNTTPEAIYNAWLDSKLHSEMTGGGAVCSSEKDGEFTAWDGYISGKNLELVPHKTIIQAWRTSEFEEVDEDSFLHIELIVVAGGTEIKLSHSNIPDGNSDYETGWVEHYFNPMKSFFK
tara:strand:+ start:1395 stop:1781 length:387 start_codon:yes stop_codon:yes gene_type:complete